jgi:glutaredoxin 3
MSIVVYSKDNCPWCDRAKDLLNVKGKQYLEVKIGRDITREEFLEQFPYVRSVPYIIHEGTEVPSYDALKALYE